MLDFPNKCGSNKLSFSVVFWGAGVMRMEKMSCLQIDYGDDHLHHHHHLYTMFKQYPRVQAIPAFINFYSQKTNQQKTDQKNHG